RAAMGKSGRGAAKRKNPGRSHQHRATHEVPAGEAGLLCVQPEPSLAQDYSMIHDNPRPMVHSLSDHIPSTFHPGERLFRRLDRHRSTTLAHDLHAARTTGEESTHSPQSRGSASSRQNRAASDNASLASVLLHYMPGIDPEDSSDLLATRYYGNMAALSGDADRHPRPMNSTLPLFSPSVIHGRIAPRGRSSRASVSAGSPQRPQGTLAADHGLVPSDAALATCPDASDSNPSPETRDQVTAPPQLVPAVDARASEQPAFGGGDVDTVSEKAGGLGIGTAPRPLSQTPARRSQFIGATQYTPAAAHKKGAIARAAPGLSYMFSPTAGSSRPPSVTGMATPAQQQAPHVQSHLAQLQSASYAPSEEPSGDALQPELPAFPSGSAEHLASEATTRSSYVHPETAMGPGEAQLPVEAGGRTSSTCEGAHATYGAVNIGILERFLEEGRIPESSSDDDDISEFSWEGDYDEPRVPMSELTYSVHAAYEAPKQPPQGHAAPMAPSRGITPIRAHTLRHGGGPALATPLQQSPALRPSQISPRIRSVRRMSGPGELTPLLQSPVDRPRAEDRLPANAASEFLVPADLAPAGEPGIQCGQQPPSEPSPERNATGPLRRRRQRSRRNHEDLFLDKDGFIDESYRFTFFNPAVGTIRAQEFADLRTPTMDLAALLQVGGCFWIDVLRPSLQEMHLLSKVFGIHALTVEDVMTQDAREKCEIHANYYFVCFRSFDSDPNSETYLEPKCVYSVVMREGIITFHMDPSVHQYHVLRRIRRQIDHIVVTPDWLNYAIIDDITDLLAPILQSVEFDVDVIDELVLVISSSEQSDMLLRISTVRKRIMMATRLLQGKADVVRALIKRFESATAISTTQMTAMAGAGPIPGYQAERVGPAAPAAWCESPRWRANGGVGGGDASYQRNPQSYPDMPGATAELALDQRKGQETLLYLGDVLDHIVTMMQNATHYDNMLGRAQTNYLAQISIELTESSNNTNDVVAKLSALAAIVVPLNFITGMWGANVKVPGQDHDDLRYFFCILCMCLLYVVCAVAWARHCKIF
ncbi:CorA metal ion transporter, partial [Coemansia biformis]